MSLRGITTITLLKSGISQKMHFVALAESLSYVNRLPRTSVLQGHKFIRESDRIVKSTSYFADGNKIERTLRGIKDRMER